VDIKNRGEIRKYIEIWYYFLFIVILRFLRFNKIVLSRTHKAAIRTNGEARRNRQFRVQNQEEEESWIHRILCLRWLPLPLDFPGFPMLHHLQDCGHLIPQTNIYLFILHEPGTYATSFFFICCMPWKLHFPLVIKMLQCYD